MDPHDKISDARRLITTCSGLLGSTIANVHPGDEIRLLPGCRMPVIVRRFGERYRLVGSAYIHGLMDDEAILELEKQKKCSSVIYLLIDYSSFHSQLGMENIWITFALMTERSARLKV